MSARFLPRADADLAALAAARPLAWIVSGEAADLCATPLPVQAELDGEGRLVLLRGHFARGNPQLRRLAAQPLAMVLLLGPQGYVSPSWLRDRTQAPTWNYAAAVLRVRVELDDTPEAAEAALGGLVEAMEQGRPRAWGMAEMGGRYASLSRGVVAFRARVDEARASFKLGQDERDDVFADILAGLARSGAHELADWMRRFAAGRQAAAEVPAGAGADKLDPPLRRFVEAIQAAGAPAADWPQRRALAERARAPWAAGGPAMQRRCERSVPTPAGTVRLRVHDPRPAGAGPGPALVYLHGGGWAMFSLDTHDRLMREYAARSGMVVVGVDYALAPEARFPVALRQVAGVLRWLRAEGAVLGIDGERLAAGGDSAGANLALAAALLLRDAGERWLRALLLNYGAYAPDCSDAARRAHGNAGDMLSAEEMALFWNTYLRDETDRAHPWANLLQARLDGLPPAFLAIAECDLLAEQSHALGIALHAAGVPVRAEVYAGAPHSFLEAVAIAGLSARALDDAARWLRAVPGLAAA
jgi:acetyl esterase/lipase